MKADCIHRDVLPDALDTGRRRRQTPTKQDSMVQNVPVRPDAASQRNVCRSQDHQVFRPWAMDASDSGRCLSSI